MCVVGAQLKADYNQVQEEWLEDPENLEKWEQQSISAGDRRILITHWLADAAERFRKRGQAICASSWARTGCGMSMDGSGDDAIVVSGVNNYSFAEPAVAADESAFVGIDEAEAKQADTEQPPTSKREDKKDQEEEDEGRRGRRGREAGLEIMRNRGIEPATNRVRGSAPNLFR